MLVSVPGVLNGTKECLNAWPNAAQRRIVGRSTATRVTFVASHRKRRQLLRAAENLHVLAGFAASLGLRLVIEPMSRFRNHLVTTAAQAVKLVRMADHPNLFVNLDTFHMITEERDYGAAIRGALPVLWGVHTCENDRGVPGGGLVPWMAVFEALTEATGCVRLLMETYRTGPEGFGYERGIFQDLAPDPDQFVQDGLRFLTRMCAEGNP